MKKQIRIILILTHMFLFSIILSIANKNRYEGSKHGISGDGITFNTKNIQSLIDKVSAEQGGTIVFPKGNYLAGSLQLRSNVHLYLEEGSTLFGSKNSYHYKDFKMPGRPKNGDKDNNSQMALLAAFKANKISISGKGRIDGQRRALALNIDRLHHIGERVDSESSTNRMRQHETMRPKLFRFSMCNNVDISGLEIQNSACWCLSFELCHCLSVDSVKVSNRAYWNNDGMAYVLLSRLNQVHEQVADYSEFSMFREL